jgi:undecaprenyl-diphosphatase
MAATTTQNDQASANEKPTTSNLTWRYRVLGIIGALLVWRIIFNYIVPLDLVHDEAYYWDWSRQLDWGYFSKPPMIAWIIGSITSLLGSSAFAVRLPAVMFGTCGLWFIYLIAERLYGGKAGFWAVLASAATPGNVAMSLLMTIDAPFLFCWSIALYSFWRLLEKNSNVWLWGALTVVAIGLGLLSKQTMLGFLVFGGLFILLSKTDRKQLARPAIWLVAGGALLFLAPVLWWNYQHDWITFQHTGDHFATESVRWWKKATESLEYIGSQAGVITPLVYLLISFTGLVGLSQFFKLGRREQYLLCFSALPLLMVALLSMRQHIEPNWPAAFYPAAMILLAGWATSHFQFNNLMDVFRRSFYPGVGLGGLFAAATYALPFLIVPLGIDGSKLDPTPRLRGWDELGSQVSQVRSEVPELKDSLVISACSARIRVASWSALISRRKKATGAPKL